MYAKLFSSILDSTIWGETDHVRIVWITMLAMADAEGVVNASVPGLAARARVEVPKCQEALKKFQDPDPYSRTPDDDGRRIATVVGGWRLLNYGKHRSRGSYEDKIVGATLRRKGYVYYAVVDNRVKIGFSTNPWARVNELKCASPGLELRAVVVGTMADEREVHQKFAGERITREWFNLTDGLKTHIDSISVATKSVSVAIVATRSKIEATKSAEAEADTEAEAEKKKSKSARSAALIKSQKTKTKSFELWWDTYPRKVAKPKAREAHQKAVLRLVKDNTAPEAEDAEAILIDSVDTLAEVAKMKGAELKFCPYPASYLNQSRWDDTREMWEILMIPKEDKRGGRNLVG